MRQPASHSLTTCTNASANSAAAANPPLVLAGMNTNVVVPSVMTSDGGSVTLGTKRAEVPDADGCTETIIGTASRSLSFYHYPTRGGEVAGLFRLTVMSATSLAAAQPCRSAPTGELSNW
jgi:hypothetical protein